MRILFFGDGRWAGDTLRRLLAEGHDIPLVVERTRPTDGALSDAARFHGIEVVRPDDVNDADFVTKIASLAGDLNVSVSFDQILKRPIVSTPPLGFVNLHAGMLPFYRGRNVVNWALINGETEIGLTAHFVDQGIDTGDIIAQVSMPILWTDTYADVLAKVVAAIPDLTARVVADIGSGRVTRRAQHELAGTYFPARRPGRRVDRLVGFEPEHLQQDPRHNPPRPGRTDDFRSRDRQALASPIQRELAQVHRDAGRSRRSPGP